MKHTRATAAAILVFLLMFSSTASAEVFELEVCEFRGTIRDTSGQTVPPGLDEELNCDHKDFLRELNLNSPSDRRPALADLYRIGWRLIEVVETRYDDVVIWTVYLERPL